jgi:hypothetical protein
MLLSFPRGTEMFQFPRFPLPALCVQAGVTPHNGCWVSPFGHPRIKACSAAPRGFSQPTTSFIGVRCQGIHRWLFIAWKNKDARTRYAVLKEQSLRHEDAGPSQARTGSAPQTKRQKRDRSLKAEERTVTQTGSTIRRPTSTYNRQHNNRNGSSESPTRESPLQHAGTMTP